MDISKIGIDLDTFKTFVNSTDMRTDGDKAVRLQGIDKRVLVVGKKGKQSGCTDNEFGTRMISQQNSRFNANHSRYQDNICLRGRLLTAVRSELGGETSATFKEIEQVLFGTGNPFGIEIGSADLTVREIKTVLDKLSDAQKFKAFNTVVLPMFNELLEANCSGLENFKPLDVEGLKKLCKDSDAYQVCVKNFGEELAAQAKALGRQVLITEHLADLERKVQDSSVTSQDMLEYVKRETFVDCDPQSLMFDDVEFTDEDLKKYILMACKAHVNGLVGCLKNVADAMKDDEKKDLRQGEIRKIFANNNVTKLEMGTSKEFESVLIAFVEVHDKKWLFKNDAGFGNDTDYAKEYEKLSRTEVLAKAKAILKEVTFMDNNALTKFGSEFGEELATEADALGQAMLIADHLLQLEFIAQDSTKTNENMAAYLKKKTAAVSHANALEQEDDSERKRYTVRICKNHVYELINGLKVIEENMRKIAKRMQEDGNTEDVIGKEVKEAREEMIRKVFTANDGTCLELRTENLELALSAPLPSSRPLVHDLNGIFSELCKNEGVRIFSEHLSKYKIRLCEEQFTGCYEEDIIEAQSKCVELKTKTFEELMEVVESMYKTDGYEKNVLDKIVKEAWDEFKDVFKSYLMSNVAGQRRQAFTLTKVDDKWSVDLLVDQKNNPIMKSVTNAEIEKMSDLLFEFCRDDPYIDTDRLGGEKNVQVQTPDERSSKPGYTYFAEMRNLANEDKSNEDFKALVNDVSGELSRHGMTEDELSELTEKVNQELNLLRNMSDESAYLDRYGRFIDELFRDGLLTNRERLRKLIENRIFYDANVELRHWKSSKGHMLSVEIPTERAMTRYLKPSAMKLASVMMVKWPEKFKDYKTCHELADRIERGCMHIRKAERWGLLYRLVDSTGRMKGEPTHENIISSAELEPIENVSDLILNNGYYI